MPFALTLKSPAATDEIDISTLLTEIPPPPGISTELWQSSLLGPLSEFLARPGKHFRSQLTRLAWALTGRRDDPPGKLPLVVELLHAGSLIIDDIEDGSLQRRGKAALHHVVGLPLALNAGNWLYFWPFDLLRQIELSPHLELAATRASLDAVRACHEGQALDLAATIRDLKPSEVFSVCLAISERKSGTLMGLAAELGAIAAGADANFTRALRTFGKRVGVALQMLNDLSELTGAAGSMKHHEDLTHGRITWPWAWAALRLPATQFDALKARGANLVAGIGNADVLARSLLLALGTDPQRPIRQLLEHAFLDLTEAVGDHPALNVVQAELNRLLKYESAPAVVRSAAELQFTPPHHQ